jgi:hypothetical protein
MDDVVFNGFLTRQWEEAAPLNQASDLVRIRPFGGTPPNRYVVDFRCTGLVMDEGGSVAESDRFRVGIWFPSDYLRRVDPFEVLTWLWPPHVFHPNISDVAPLICIGRLTRGTPLVEIVYRVFDVITFNNVTMVEHDALNRRACVWARENRGRFPVDRRPLKRRTLDLTVTSRPS